MPLTSLEAIAEKLQENRQNQLEDILRVSGSNAIAKDQYGITTVDENNVATSLVFKSLNKPKINIEELTKAIDVEVTELRPDIPIAQRDLVPKPLYDEEVANNENLRAQLDTLNSQIDTLNTTITDLRSQVETEINNRLNIEQSNDVLVNQLTSLTGTVEEFSSQIQNAIQKSVDESILRASLQAQNVGFKAQIESLIKQIDSLNSIIEGLQAQLGAVQQQQAIENSTQNLAFASGGDVINEVLVFKTEPKVTDNAIIGRINNKSREIRWEGGASIEITNNDSQPVTVTLNIQNPPNQNWLVVNPTTYVLPTGKTHKISFGINVDGCNFGRKDNSVFHDGRFTVSVKRADGSEKSKTYPTRINIMHPKSF
ncbi:hypothetical protein UFOVP449_70 [uncultured Caudovirales phage]|uniref:Uncharacterized protein n=1 Tax=uncultured Caudovirales phage TaxID=2100421 RepID=A0A6J5M7H7_9CAUD|nr:hypothetical protein UFOVP449_70 [uncultured Caudovirales phage]